MAKKQKETYISIDPEYRDCNFTYSGWPEQIDNPKKRMVSDEPVIQRNYAQSISSLQMKLYRLNKSLVRALIMTFLAFTFISGLIAQTSRPKQLRNEILQSKTKEDKRRLLPPHGKTGWAIRRE